MEPDNPNNLNPAPPAPAPTAATPSLQPNQDKKALLLKVGALGLILVILAGVAVFIFTNPKEKPQTAEELAVSLSQPNRSTHPFIRCPVVQEQCAGGQTESSDADGETIYAIKFTLGSGSQVFAAMAGEITVESPNSFLITNVERGIGLRYVLSDGFIFDDENASSYGEDNSIGTFSGQRNTLTLYARSIRTDQPIRLGIGEGGQYLTNLE